MRAPPRATPTDTFRMTTRVPRDWIPLLEQFACKEQLVLPGRGVVVADAVRALLLEGLTRHGIEVKSVVQARDTDDPKGSTDE